MLDAVLFDWGDTLFHFAWDEELIEAGWRAGIAALGRDDLPGHDVAAARFREEYLPVLWLPDALDEIEYPGMVREVFEHLGASVSDDDVARFLEAEHAAWAPARHVGDASHALLDALRERGLKTALVSNAFDPPWLLHRDLEDMGFSERLDAAVFSSEVGKRKPHPAIFEEALGRLGVDPDRALFVGDRRVPDIQGARAVGMSTVLAYWFRADPEEDGIEPDYEAFTQMDVLNIVRRLTGET